jgi:hypothetical protein
LASEQFTDISFPVGGKDFRTHKCFWITVGAPVNATAMAALKDQSTLRRRLS